MGDAEEDVLAFIPFPNAHWSQTAIANSLGNVKKKIKCHSRVVGIFPSDAATFRIVSALLVSRSTRGT